MDVCCIVLEHLDFFCELGTRFSIVEDYCGAELMEIDFRSTNCLKVSLFGWRCSVICHKMSALGNHLETKNLSCQGITFILSAIKQMGVSIKLSCKISNAMRMSFC